MKKAWPSSSIDKIGRGCFNNNVTHNFNLRLSLHQKKNFFFAFQWLEELNYANYFAVCRNFFINSSLEWVFFFSNQRFIIWWKAFSLNFQLIIINAQWICVAYIDALHPIPLECFSKKKTKVEEKKKLSRTHQSIINVESKEKEITLLSIPATRNWNWEKLKYLYKQPSIPLPTSNICIRWQNFDVICVLFPYFPAWEC